MHDFYFCFSPFLHTLSANTANAKLISSASAEEIPSAGEVESSSPRIRNRYLKRVGVNDQTDDDLDPLLGE